MSACILLSHVFVRPGEQHKLDQILFTLVHYRAHNPNAYIILTGHGVPPCRSTIGLCNHVYWCNTIIDQEIDKGHPRLVSVGIEHAVSKGFTHLLKCRSDGVILRENITDFCRDKLGTKQILLTQQTELVHARAGDLFMYGNTYFLQKCWDIRGWYPTNTGLTSLARNILKLCGMNSEQWAACLRTYAAFVDIFNIRWIDFRANWVALQPYLLHIIRNQLPNFEKYLWGTTEKWHVFDQAGNMRSRNSGILSEKTWHENYSTSR